jgi:hypothetical protein
MKKKRSEKPLPEGTILHKCKENENHLYITDLEEDSDGFVIDGEIQAGDQMEDNWIVIGLRDLAIAMNKANIDLSHVYDSM